MKTATKLRFSAPAMRAARSAAGLTQERLAGLIGYSRDTINGYETGRREPGKATAIAIASALHIKLGELYPDGAACPTCSDTPPAGFRCTGCGATTPAA
jgi:transcriptional regulator with XRE-family HTH domain